MGDWIGVVVLLEPRYYINLQLDVGTNTLVINRTETKLTKSKALPVPSEFRAQTGFSKGWNESAQQSKGVLEPGCGASCLLNTSIRVHVEIPEVGNARFESGRG